jgi:hypothetical protein
MGGSQSRSEGGGEKKNPVPALAGTRTPVVRSLVTTVTDPTPPRQLSYFSTIQSQTFLSFKF